MTRHGIALLMLSIIAIAGWAYNVNYNTKAAIERVSTLRSEIAAEREALRVLKVEWAYLNAPDRLSRLVGEHNDHLHLVPMVPGAFGISAAVPFPPKTLEERQNEEVYTSVYPRVGGIPVPVARPVPGAAPSGASAVGRDRAAARAVTAAWSSE
ncbi:MAG: cell division protein FtsL [Pseudomonadota bacterium]